MDIYKHKGIYTPAEARLPAGTIGYAHTITSAIITGPSFDERKNVLQLNLIEEGRENAPLRSYGLIGQDVYEPFMKEMGAGLARDLEGKQVTAHLPPLEDMVRGLSIRK